MAERASIGVGMIGCGTVGGGVAKLLREMGDLYAQRLGKRLELRRVLVRDAAKATRTGLVEPARLTADPEAFFATRDMPIVIEVAGGQGAISDYARRALTLGKHLVTANKSMLAAEGAELFALARAKGISIAFEASCGGGIPIITAMQFGLMANRIDALYGILNGTCNYILTEMVQRGKPYAQALGEAQEKGFAEADPALDVSGRDTAQKLAVLASLAFGVRVRGDQVWSEGIDNLDVADIRFGVELGYNIKLLAIGERTKLSSVQRPASSVKNQKHVPDTGHWTLDTGLSLRVHPCFIQGSLPLAQVHGSFNALSVYGHANGHTHYYGRGAGQMPTASAVVSDLLNVAAGWYPQAFAGMNLWADRQAEARLVDAADLTSRYYLRVNAKDVPGRHGQDQHHVG